MKTELQRFSQDHATPDAVAAFFSTLEPDASLDDMAEVLRAAGYRIASADLQDVARGPAAQPLSDRDLDAVSGGAREFWVELFNGTKKKWTGFQTSVPRADGQKVSLTPNVNFYTGTRPINPR